MFLLLCEWTVLARIWTFTCSCLQCEWIIVPFYSCLKNCFKCEHHEWRGKWRGTWWGEYVFVCSLFVSPFYSPFVRTCKPGIMQHNSRWCYIMVLHYMSVPTLRFHSDRMSYRGRQFVCVLRWQKTILCQKNRTGCVGAHGCWFNVKRLYFLISTIISQNLFLYSKVRFKYHYPPL